MIELYSFQHDVVGAIEAAIAAGIKRILVVAATGAGKTIIASEFIKRNPMRTVLFLAHRDELLTQARDKLKRFDVTAGIIKAGRDKDARPQALVQVAGVQTLYWRGIRTDRMDMPKAQIVFVDEAHHVRARTYQLILEQYPDAIVIGLTATPCRGDGRGLGNTFETMIEAPPVAERGAIPNSQQVGGGGPPPSPTPGWSEPRPLTNPPGTNWVDAIAIADDVRQRSKDKR
jgi:superfamily II DNA or RNA helicase